MSCRNHDLYPTLTTLFHRSQEKDFKFVVHLEVEGARTAISRVTHLEAVLCQKSTFLKSSVVESQILVLENKFNQLFVTRTFFIESVSRVGALLTLGKLLG